MPQLGWKHLGIVLLLCLTGGSAWGQASPAAARAPETFPAVSLRGYGKIAAKVEYRGAPERPVSALRIDCESPEKAALLHAKYLSDLQALPGVSPIREEGESGFPVWEVKDQGFILAAREDRTVFLLAAEGLPALRETALALFKDPARLQFEAGAAVPEYLDKWDEHGWSFYQWTWFTPNKRDHPWLADYDFSAPYNYDAEYRWAQQNRTGLVLWRKEFSHDRGAGMNDIPWIDWVPQACTRYGLDFQVQPTLGDNLLWWANRYRDETMQKMPGYVGSYHAVNNSYFGGPGAVSWCSRRGKDGLLALSQAWLRRHVDNPLLTTIMEPHCEVAHGEYDLLLEYGPLADASFREFLQKQRKFSLGDLSRRWGQRFTNWEQVRVPELASFMGWGPQALDLAGTWKVKYASLEEGREQSLFAPQTDDSAWGEIVSPGHDRQMFLDLKPAWFRRRLVVPEGWLRQQAGKPLYLYLWDLNQRNAKSPVVIYLDGELLATDVREAGIGVAIAPLPAGLRAGEHLLAVYLPQGFIGYRVYLAAWEPLTYPYLGKEMNARWVDFRDWQAWTRAEAIRRSLEMIRGVDPNRPISLAAPDAVADYAKELAVQYGGFFHNTGYMSAWYGDYHARLMRSVGLPSSAEPGGPADSLETLKAFWWRIVMAGCNAYNYFIHIGNIMWHPQMRAWFEAQQPMIHLLGKYHLPETRVAALNGVRAGRLAGWPWYRNKLALTEAGYWRANVTGHLPVPADLLTEMDVAAGRLSNYDLVFDEMTTIMDDQMVQKIEDWVRSGGTFVTLVNTGRHTEEQPDAWPIRRLTGFEVLWTSKQFEDGHSESFPLKLEPGQKVFDPAYWGPPKDPEVFGRADGPWPGIRGNGIAMKPLAPECEVLMRWAHDDSVAVGRRPLGRGQVFVVGVKFFEDRFWWGNREHQDKFENDIAAFCGIQSETDARVNGQFIAGGAALHDAPLGRWFISNNGLYDVYMICNHGQEPADFTLSVRAGERPAPWAWDVLKGQELPGQLAEGRVSFPPLRLEPLELRALLVPRGKIIEAPREWLRLQIGWWQGTASGQRLQPDKYEWVLDLTEGWTLTPAADDQFSAPAGKPLTGVALGPWTYVLNEPVRNATFEREFTVPATWKEGKVYLHVSSWVGSTFLDKGRVLLDGEVIRDFNEGQIDVELSEALKAGTKHTLALQVRGGPYAQGLRGPAWLEYEPRPAREMALAGEWEPSPDVLTRTARVPLPGTFEGRMARANVPVPADWKGQTVMIHAVTEPPGPTILGVIINGKWLRRHHHVFGTRLDINITPLLEYGQPNEIELVATGAGKVNVAELSLRAYPAGGIYP